MNRTFSANAPALAELQDNGGGNPQSAATVATQLSGKGPTKSDIVEVVLECMSPNVKQLLLRDAPLRIALVIHDCSLNDNVVSAIRNPVSTCCIDSLTVLNPSTEKEEAEEKEGHIEAKGDRLRKDASEWLGRYHAQLDTIDILQGHSGFEEILRRESVDAVYIYVPANLQQTYVLGALQARKHVLLKDPVSTPCDDFLEQMRYAVQAGKFIQFSTMFLHHFSAQTFIDCVCARNTFGAIQHVDAILAINLDDLDKINVRFPLTTGQGCVRRLARYCLLITTLMLEGNNKPLKATVEESCVDEKSGQPTSATCMVQFSGNVTLRCKVAYCRTATRQVLTVKSATNRYATMTDFVLPHPDGLATYRVYDKELDPVTKRLEVIRGECMDVPTGSPQDVSLWREFHRLCSSVDQAGGWNASTCDAQRLTESSLQTKSVLKALDESFARGAGTWADVTEQPSSF